MILTSHVRLEDPPPPRRSIEEMKIQQESLVTGMKKKQHQDSMTEMNEQCDQLTKMKSK